MRNQSQWRDLLASVLKPPFEFVGVMLIGGKRQTQVRLYVDKPGGITIDEIARLSRQIGVVLDVENVIKGAYSLEVSSPGLDRPLFFPAHFRGQIGEKISLKTHLPISNQQNFKGVLIDADEEGIKLDAEGESLSLVYSQIDKARVIPNI